MAAMVEKTTIEVQRTTWQKLNTRKEPGDSFDDVIQELLLASPSVGSPPAPHESHEGDETPLTCPHCEYSWTYEGAMSKATCPNCSGKVPVEH